MAATESFVAPLACSQPESHGKVKTFLTSSQFETHCKVRTPVKVAVNSVVGMLVKAVVASEVGDLSESAVNSAFDLPPAVDELDHHIDIRAFQWLLSEAESEAHAGVSEEGSCEEDDPPNVAETSVNDVNILKEGEHADAYESSDISRSDGDD
ncbi:hypothetical protein PInf_007687 [Phytophthora infestans]|nr:hypothetical protein PInf_007687 [Phytophthora infestans]